MVKQQPQFVYTNLEWKLHERLTAALDSISSLPKEDILQCGSGCLTEIVRQFAIASPILRLDLMVADKEIVETVDHTFDRKTGNTGHIFLIPVERGAEWLDDIANQRTTTDDSPLAFFDKERGQISIRLMVSPEDAEGTLKQKLNYRSSLIEQYSESVGRKLTEYNKGLAEKMTLELNKRKGALIKAERELEDVGLPRVHNPQHEERAVKIERLMQSLGRYVKEPQPKDKESVAKEVRLFIVHGHDHKSLYELKDYLQNTLKLGEPVVLRQMPGRGKTLLEKFEREAEAVQVVFVLLTPDDEVATTGDSDEKKRRARQNVIFELGFFLGKLGRESGQVLLLHKGPVEMPSDIVGIEYIDISNGIESAGESIRREKGPKNLELRLSRRRYDICLSQIARPV